jgi:hypothetical protein
MPAGISEQLLAKAYGPIDLSGLYKGMENTAKQLALQEKQYRQENLKQYGQEMSKLEQMQKGIKNEDLLDIQGSINNWKSANMQLLNNPNLINRNPQKYAELQSLVDKHLGDAKSKILESQEAAKEEMSLLKDMKDHPERYKQGAYDEYMKNVSTKPTSYSTSSKVKIPQYDDYGKKVGDSEYSLRDRQLYENPLEGYSKWDSELNKGFKSDKTKYAPEEKDNLGQVRQREFLNVPEYAEHYNNSLSKFKEVGDTHKALGYADKVLSEASDYGDVVKTFSALQKDKKSLAQYGLNPEDSKHILFGDINSEVAQNGKIQTAAKYLAMKQFITDASRITEKPTQFKFPSEAAKMKAEEQKQKNLIDYHFKKTAERLGTSANNFDIGPAFKAMSLGGEKGAENIKKITSEINSNDYLGPRVTPFIWSSKYHKSAWKDSPAILNKLDIKGDNISDAVEKINKANADANLIGLEVSEGSLRSGKVLAIQLPASDKTMKPIVIDMQNPEATNFMNKLIRKNIESKKQLNISAKGISLSQADSYGLN